MAPLLKNLYNKEYISNLSNALKINKDDFSNKIFDKEWKNRELKQRMRHIANSLAYFLADDYSESIEILKNTFSKLNHSYALENMIFQDYVEVYGLNDFKISMNALEHFTNNSSSEFAIRQFILKYPDATMAQMQIWASSANHHVRRLASEGCRPRLPWAIALSRFKKDPSEILPILKMLRDDESEYVRKSVANSINDISKDNPQTVKKLASQWIGKNKNRDSLLKHGCRTLFKARDKEILTLFGFAKPDNIKLDNFKIMQTINMGEILEFSFCLNSKSNLGRVRIEYIIYFLRKNGNHNTKVFKISEGVFNQNKKIISKKHSFKPISSRKYYKGKHKLAITVNGVIFAKKEFMIS